jgi:hypothetical protein
MNREAVARIANTVLYEGLYPRRSSAERNQQRFHFGVLYPREHCEMQRGSDAWESRTECIVTGDTGAQIEAQVRFLRPIARAGWQEGSEQTLDTGVHSLNTLLTRTLRRRFELAGFDEAGARQESLDAEIELDTREIAEGVFRLGLSVRNRAKPEGAADREQVLLHSMVSVHSILQVQRGEFVSLMDPPNTYREAARKCRNTGTWPVLVGDGGQRNFLLSSPIILYDYPKILAESSGDGFDVLRRLSERPQ